jgi:Tfp pilus assembly PilM family ATPase
MNRSAALGLLGPLIGVDLGTRTVNACQRNGQGWRTMTMIRDRSDAYTAEEIGTIVRALARHGMAGTQVAVSLPHAKLLIARAPTPKENSGAPVEEIARQELGRSNGVEGEQLISLSWSARSRRSRGELDERQVMGCIASVVDEIHDGFAAHGMDVDSIEPGVIAAARGGFNAVGLSGQDGLLVDLGWSSARLVAVSGSRLVYMRQIADFGMGRLAAQVALACSLSEQHAWVIGGLMARPGGCEAVIEARRVVISVVSRFADGLMLEIERGAAFARERYGVNTDQGVVLSGGGGMGLLGDTLRTISDGQLMPASGQGTTPELAAARGLAMMMEGSHACRQSAA